VVAVVYEEKRAWIMALVSVVTYAAYLVVVLGRLGDASVTDVSYASLLLWTVGISIGVQILLAIVVGGTSEGARQKDSRDREIHQFSQYVAQGFIVIGGVAALLLALGEADHFWIANALYLGFTLSGVVSSVAKIITYRTGLPSW
jgi:hypothetical protein